MSAAAELRDAVRDARRAGRPIAASTTPGGGDDELGLADGYAIQRELFAGRELLGYKLGLVSVAKQRQMGLSSPVFGRVAPEMLHDGHVDLDAFVQPRVEPEIAVILSDHVQPGATRGQVERAIGGAFIAVDVLDSVWHGYRFSLSQVVADNTSGGGFLLGDRLVPLDGTGELTLSLDGEVLGSGPVAALGDAIANVAWLGDETGGLAPGTVIFLGAPTAAVPARAGTLELRGPAGSVLTARLRGETEHES